MSPSHNDRNLHLGILALQNGFITRDQLVAAMTVWLADKSKFLIDILAAQNALAPDRRQLLDALAQVHLGQHDNDPQRSLASISSLDDARQVLAELDDPDIDASLQNVKFYPRAMPPSPLPSPAADSSTVDAPASGPPRFRILRQHAKGGLGIVYVAHDREVNRRVALKEIQLDRADDQDSRQRFELEAEITGGLEHPGIVPVYGLGHYADGRPYYAMRFIKGASLKEAADAFHAAEKPGRDPVERDLSIRQLLRRFYDVCNAIEYAHSKGVLHRDLKPGNIMLGKFGETLVVDWGLAKVTGKADAAMSADLNEVPLTPASGSGATPTQMGSAIGTPAYMSPEQAAGRLDLLGPASDVYSLGATLYYLLVGKPPFERGNRVETLNGVQKGAFPRPREANSKVPAALEAICLKGMSLTPAARYASAEALRKDLENWIDDAPVSAWREPLSVKARRWLSRHRLLATTSVAMLLVALVSLGVVAAISANLLAREEYQKRQRALAQINALRDADAGAVPAILRELDENRASILPQLRERYAAEPPGKQRMRLALAILPTEPEAARNELADWMLRAESPAEVLLAREALAPHQDALLDKLWASAESPAKGKGPQRLRAAAALAKYDPNNEKWTKASAAVVNDLVQENAIFLGPWTDAFRPVRIQLLPGLSAIFRDPHPERIAERKVATNLIAEYAADQPSVLADLLLDADEKQYAVLFPLVKGHGERFVSELNSELAKHPDGDNKEVLAKRQANAAVALLRMNRPEKVWPLLKHSPDPRMRSYLIHRLAPMGADAATIVKRLQIEPDPTIRRALILSLGEGEKDLSPADRMTQAEIFKGIYRSDDDSGLHAAAEWLLRTWEQDKWLKMVNEEWANDKVQRDKRLERIGQAIAKEIEKRAPQWYVTGQGQTMVVFPGPVEFVMGSPATEADRKPNESQHTRRIGRTFAVAAKAVTMEQFRKFFPTFTVAEPSFYRTADLPVAGTSWFQAAVYCNWLSQKEGIAEDQWCYEVNNQSMKLKNHYLSLAGYRLPTEAEMEYATRAGASTSRFFGETEELLAKYAWYFDNSMEKPWPVGSLKQNDFGLFDVYGNTSTWCQETYQSYPIKNGAVDDVEDGLVIVGTSTRVLRGSAFTHRALFARSSFRSGNVPVGRGVNYGFRLARTLTP